MFFTSKSDVESQSHMDDVILNNVNNTSNISRNSEMLRERMNEKRRVLFYVKVALVIFLFVIYFPIILCDFYFGMNEKSCVMKESSQLLVGINDYLIVSALNLIMVFVVVSYFILSLNSETQSSDVYCFYFIILIMSLFNIVWNVIGGVIFWANVEESSCSNSMYNYVTISLIIKYIGIVFNARLTQKKDE